MEGLIEVVAVALTAYLVGSLPAAYLIGRLASNKDVREVGEGNVGARNVFHEVGNSWGIAAFVVDFLKGTSVAAMFAGGPGWQILVAGVFVFLGHAFPVWLGFVGGKGLSTVGGFSVVIVPWAAVLGVVASGVVWMVRRRFLPTLVMAVVGTIVTAPLLGYELESTGLVIGLFALTGVKRALDEPRMRRVEAQTGWDRLHGGTAQ